MRVVSERVRSERRVGVGASRELDDERSHRLFAVLFGVAFVIFFAETRLAPQVINGPVDMNMVVPAAFALGMALRPSSVPLFVGFFATYTYFLLLGFPENNTNQTLTFFVGLAILGSAAVCSFRARSVRITGAALFREYLPILQLCMVGLYFWTAWHKLNTDFTDPDVSCSGPLSAQLFGYFGSRAPDGLGPVAVMMTLLAEGALAVGLLFRRTQGPTALFGLAFHWLLGIAGFFGFSVTMMALLPLFLMPVAAQVVAGHDRPYRVWLNRAVLLAYVGLTAGAKLLFAVDTAWLTAKLFVALPLVIVALLWLNWSKVPRFEVAFGVHDALRRPTILWFVPAALFLNGASPFLGFKTEYSFAMYSNLRTEGGASNHLFWRRPWELFGYQNDLVRVLPGSDRVLLEPLGGRPVTRYELTSIIWQQARERGRRGIRIVLLDRGKVFRYGHAETIPELLREPSFLERKMLKFRRIIPARRGECAH